MNGKTILDWRNAHGASQRALADMLGVSDAAVNRWENGQEIPGPASKLLDLLINGVQPFSTAGNPHDPAAEDKHFWKLRLSLEQWHELESRASKAGYGTVRDYLLSLIREHLDEAQHIGLTATIPFPNASESQASAMVAEESAPDSTPERKAVRYDRPKAR